MDLVGEMLCGDTDLAFWTQGFYHLKLKTIEGVPLEMRKGGHESKAEENISRGQLIVLRVFKKHADMWG